jgi:hypothetical protein
MDFVEKVKGFLLEPSNTFDVSKEDTLFEALKYYFILVLINSVLKTLILIFFGKIIVSMMGKFWIIPSNAGIGETIMSSARYLVYAIPTIFIGGIILHIGVYISGGKKGANQTTKALAYSSTPSLFGWIPTPLLFGWIPVINIITVMWSLGLYIIGIREFQEISTERALLAVVIPLILLYLVYWTLLSTVAHAI